MQAGAEQVGSGQEKGTLFEGEGWLWGGKPEHRDGGGRRAGGLGLAP